MKPTTLVPVEVLKAFEAVPDLYLVLSPELEVLAVSEAFLQAFRTRREEWVGKNLFGESLPGHLMQQVFSPTKVKEAFGQVLSGKKPAQVPLQLHGEFPCTNGTDEPGEKFLRLHLTPGFNGQEELQYLLVKVEDQTELNMCREKVLSFGRDTAQLREAKEHLRLFLTASSELVYRMNADWTQMYQLSGFKEEFLTETKETSATWLDQYILPEDQSHVWAVIQEAINQKRIFELEHRVITAHNSVGWVSSRAIPVLNEKGEIEEWFGAANDITPRKEAEEQLKCQQELLRATLDSSLDMIQVFEAVRDESGQVVDFIWVLNNPTSEEWYGNVLGKKLLEYNPGVVEEGIFAAFVRVVETGVPEQYEQHYVHEQFNGWFTQSVVKLNDGVATTTADITARKKAEQELLQSKNLLQDIIDAPQIGMAVYKAVRDEQGQVLDFVHEFINKRTIEILGGHDMTGMLLSDHGEVGSKQISEFAAVLATGKVSSYTIQRELLGTPHWISISNAHLDEDRLVHTWEDVTEQKQVEEELRDSKNLVQTVFDVTLNPTPYHKAVRDQKGTIIDFEFELENLEARKYAHVDYTGKRYSEAYPGIMDTELFALYCQVVETGDKLDRQVKIELKGNTRWFHLMAVKLGDGLVATAVDITERRKADEEILRLKDEIAQYATDKYFSLFNSIDEGFCIIELLYDVNGKAVDYRWLEANPKYEKHSGINNPAGKLGSEIFPATENYWLENYDKVLKTGKASRFENWHQPTERWYQTYASRIGDNDSRQIAIVFDDITERKQLEQQQAFLLTFSDALRAETTPEAVAYQAIELLIEHLQLDRSYITSYYLEDNLARLDYQIGNDTVPPLPDHFVLSDFPEALKATQEGTLVIEDDWKRQGLTEEEMRNSRQLGMRAMVAATLHKTENRPYWSMVAISSLPRRWTQAEIKLVEEVAERTWAAVERAKAEEALRRNQMRILIQKEAYGSAINAAPIAVSLNILSQIVKQELGNHVRIAFYLAYPDGDSLHAIEGAGDMPPSYTEPVDGFPIGEDSFCSGYAIATGRPALTRDVLEDPKWQPYRHLAIDHHFRATSSYPILTRNGKAVGSLALYFPEVHEPTAQEFAVADAVTQASAIILSHHTEALERIRAQEALSQSEEKYRTIFETIDEGFTVQELITDETDRVIDFIFHEANEAFEHHTGIKDIVGKRAGELVSHIEQNWLDAMTLTYQTGEPSRTEGYHTALDRWMSLHFSQVGGQGSKLLAVVFENITERKQQEQRQDYLLKLGDSLRLLTDSAQIKFAACELLGATLGVTRVYYAEVVDDDQYILIERGYAASGEFPLDGIFDMESFGSAVNELRKGNAVISNSITDDKELTGLERQAYAAISIEAMVICPLIRNDRFVGTLSINNSSPRNWSASDLITIQATADRLWSALQKSRAEEALRESEKRFHSIANLVPDLLWDSEADGSTNWYNHRWLEYTGQRIEEAIGWGWIDTIHPDDREASGNRYGEAVKAGTPLRQEHRIRRYDGEYRWFVVSASPVMDENGHVIRMYGAATDIHDRKQAEEALRKSEARHRTLFDSIDEGVCLFEKVPLRADGLRDYRYLAMNPVMQAMFHVPDLSGQSIRENFPDEVEACYDDYDHVLETGQSLRFERESSPQGMVLEMYITRVDDGSGKHLLAVMKDVTERKRRERNADFLNEINKDLSLLSAPDDIIQTVGERIGRFMQASSCIFADVDEAKNEASIYHGWNVEAVPSLKQTFRLADYFGEEFRRAGRAGETVVVNDTARDAHANAEAYAKLKLGAFVTVPFQRSGHWVANITVTSQTAREWRVDEVQLLKEIASQVFPRIDRAHAEEALRRSEEKYRSIFETIDEGFTIQELVTNEYDTVIDIIYHEANEAFIKHTGLKNIVGKKASELFPHLEQHWLDTMALVYKTGKPVRTEGYQADINRWITLQYSRVGEPGSKFLSVVFQDITENKQREQQQEFHLKFSDALRAETAPDAIVTRALHMLASHLQLDRCHVGVYRLEEDWCEFPYQVGNDRIPPMPEKGLPLSGFPEALQIASDETLVIPDFQNARGLSETDKRNFKALGFGAAVIATVRKGENNPLWSIAAVSGRPRRWTNLEIQLLEEATERTWAAFEKAHAQEALRQSEVKFRTLFDSIDEGYCIIELMFDAHDQAYDWRYLEVNPAFEKNNGLTNATGKTILELAPDIEPKWFEIYGNVAHTGEPHRFEEYSAAFNRWFNLYAFRVGLPEERKVAVLFYDVTQRKETEASLKKSEEQFRRAIEDAPIPVIMHAEDGEVLQISRTWTELTGYRQEEVPTFDHWLTQAYGEGAEEVRTHMQQFFTGQISTVDIEFPVRTLNGKVRHWSFSASSPGTLQDNRRFIVGMAVDITERRKAEEQLQEFNAQLEQQVAERTKALQESKDQFEAAINVSPVILSVLHSIRNAQQEILDFHLNWVSASGEKLMGRDVTGERLLEQFPYLHKVGVFEKFVKIIESGQSTEFENLYRTQERDLWVRWKAVKLEDGLFVSVEDITERKKTEKAMEENLTLLRQSEEVARMGSWEYNLQTGSYRWSDGMYRLFGLPLRTPVHPETYLEYVVEEDRATAQKMVEGLRKGHEPTEDTLRVQVNGNELMFKIKGVALHNTQGEVEKVLGVDLDISEVFRLEQDNLKIRLEQQKALLLAILEAQEEERRRISESLHNGVAQILYATKLNLGRAMEQDQESGKVENQQLQTVEDLLSESINETRRVSHELVPMLLQEFGLKLAVENMCQKFEDSALFMQCKVEGLEQRLEPYLEIALFRMSQELVNNIVKHSGATAASLSLRMQGDQMVLQAKDNGRGIRAEKVNSKGLGLKSIQDRVKLLNGILAISTPKSGKGTLITIQVPARF